MRQLRKRRKGDFAELLIYAEYVSGLFVMLWSRARPACSCSLAHSTLSGAELESDQAAAGGAMPQDPMFGQHPEVYDKAEVVHVAFKRCCLRIRGGGRGLD